MEKKKKNPNQVLIVCCMILEQKEINYPDDALFGFSNKFALELFGHLRVEELGERSLYG